MLFDKIFQPTLHFHILHKLKVFTDNFGMLIALYIVSLKMDNWFTRLLVVLAKEINNWL